MPLDNPLRVVDDEAWIRRVHAVLQRAFRRAGHGSIKRVEAALEISEGSFRQWRRRGRLEIDMLFRTLAELSVDPGRFWVEVFGGELDPVQLAKRPTGPPRDPVVRHAVARWQGPPPSGSTTMGEENWRRLDEMRGEDPKLAVKRIKVAFKTAEKQWIPRLLAAYGSARRAQAQLDQAVEALHYALLLAEGSDRRAICADILQRLGVAYAYTGNHALGLLFAKEAAYEHRMAGNRRGEGRSWVDQGSRYFHLRRFDDSVAANKAALQCLPDDEIRNRFSAFQCLATTHLRMGDLRMAAEFLRRAEVLTPGIGQDLAALFVASKAKVAVALGDYAEAERWFQQELEIYRTISPIDAAIVSVELAHTQLLRGRLDDALDTIKGMSAFLEPLKDNQIISEVTRQLILLALAGQRMTRRILDQALRLLKKERARQIRRALGKI